MKTCKFLYSKSGLYDNIREENERSGISGVGATPDGAFNDFIRSWKELNGFEWIERTDDLHLNKNEK